MRKFITSAVVIYTAMLILLWAVVLAMLFVLFSVTVHADPTEENIPCVCNCKCDDTGDCKCFVAAGQTACRCKKCTCKEE